MFWLISSNVSVKCDAGWLANAQRATDQIFRQADLAQNPGEPTVIADFEFFIRPTIWLLDLFRFRSVAIF
jgi:hypothetical protein